MTRWTVSLLGLALTVFGVVALSGPGRIDIEDGQARYEAGRNLVDHGDPSIRDPRVVWHRFPGRDRREYTYYRFPGEGIAALSIVVGEALGIRDEGRLHFTYSLHGAAIASGLAIVFATWFRRQGLTPQRAMLWAIGGIVCTPCWYYATTTFDDLLGTLAVVCVIVAADRSRTEGGVWPVLAALALAIAINCKQPLAAILLPAMVLADSPTRSRRHRLVRASILIAGIIVGYSVYRSYHEWKFPPEVQPLHEALIIERELTIFGGNSLEAIIDYAVGPSSGALWYCPTVVLGVAGFLSLRRRNEHRLAIAYIIAFAAMIVFFSLLTFYKGGVCWGPRYLTPIFAILWLYAPSGASLMSRKLVRVLLILGVIVQIMALSLIPERLYVQRELPTGFYRVHPWLYLNPALGHIVNRPAEIMDAMFAPIAPEFTPGPTPTFSLPVFDPPDYIGPKGLVGIRRYTLLNTYRPWWVTFSHLPSDQRPVNIYDLSAILLLSICIGMVVLYHCNRQGNRS